MKNQIIGLFSLCLLFLACTTNQENINHVTIQSKNGQYQFYINDKPFEIKGVGLDYTQGKHFEALKAAGGNTFRLGGRIMLRKNSKQQKNMISWLLWD